VAATSSSCYTLSLALVPSRIVLEAMDTSWDMSVTSMLLCAGRVRVAALVAAVNVMDVHSILTWRMPQSAASVIPCGCMQWSNLGHSSISWYSVKHAVHDIIVMLGFLGQPSRGPLWFLWHQVHKTGHAISDGMQSGSTPVIQGDFITLSGQLSNNQWVHSTNEIIDLIDLSIHSRKIFHGCIHLL